MARKLLPVKIFTLDTETYGLEGEIKRIAIYDGVDVFYGYNFEDVLSNLRYYADDFRCVVYIHNLEFDIRKLTELFDRRMILWSQSKLINGKFACIKTVDFELRDSFKLLPESLESISKSFQVPHAKLDLWERINELYPNQYKDKGDYFMRVDVDEQLYITYLAYDVLSLYEVIDKLMFLSGIEVEKFSKLLTTASLSRAVFKTRYKYDYDKLCCNKYWESDKQVNNCMYDDAPTYIQVENILRQGYFGGRTEVFKPILEHKGFHYDVNSLYPSQMIDNFFPIGAPCYFRGKDAEERFNDWMENRSGLGFLKCKVYVPFQNIPPLPCKKGKLIFPTGHFEGVYTNVELEYAINNCDVVIEEFEEYIHFNKVYKIFNKFINDFSKMKEEAKKNKRKAEEKFSKLIQNVAYGYTGMNRDDKTQLANLEDKTKYEDEGKFLFEYEDLGFIEVQSDVRAEYIQPQVACYVTSYARLVLLDALRKMDENGNVYYCDTDSIVCDKPLPIEMVNSYKLGYWDLEKEPESGIFLQPKVYYENCTDSETKKFKGISRDTVNNFNEETYKSIFNMLSESVGGKITVETNKKIFRSVKYSLKVGADMNNMEIRDKQLNLDNKQKRQMFYNENRTEPYYFSSLEKFRRFNFDVNYIPYELLSNDLF